MVPNVFEDFDDSFNREIVALNRKIMAMDRRKANIKIIANLRLSLGDKFSIFLSEIRKIGEIKCK
jgi:hypothetical protein